PSRCRTATPVRPGTGLPAGRWTAHWWAPPWIRSPSRTASGSAGQTSIPRQASTSEIAVGVVTEEAAGADAQQTSIWRLAAASPYVTDPTDARGRSLYGLN